MGRWRPSAEKSSPYITKEGYERLNGELKEILSKVVYGIRRHSCLTDPVLVHRP